jgi:hypothetical protein
MPFRHSRKSLESAAFFASVIDSSILSGSTSFLRKAVYLQDKSASFQAVAASQCPFAIP